MKKLTLIFYNFSLIKCEEDNNLLLKDSNELYELELKTKKAREEFIDKLTNNNLEQDVK